MAISIKRNYSVYSDPNAQPQAGVGFEQIPSLKGKPAQSILSFENGSGGIGMVSGSGAGMARLSNPAAQQRIADQLAINANPEFQARMAQQSKIVDDRIAARLANERASQIPMLGQQQQPQFSMPQLAGRSPELQALMDKATTDLNGNDRLKAKYAQKTIDSILSQDAQQAQNMTSQQGQLLDLQKARESLQQQQAQHMSDQAARASELAASQAFSNQQMKDKFGMDLSLQQMQAQQQAALEASKPAPLSPYEKKAQQEQATIDAQKAAERDRYAKTLNMLDDNSDFGKNINNLISQSTGGAIGTAADAAGRAFGYTTSGAKAASELTPFANQLVMMMPRGPGAQSDRDVAIATGMAGAIADTTKTVEERQAAFKGLKDFYKNIAMQHGLVDTKGQQQQGLATASPPQQQNTDKNQPSFDDLMKKYGG